MKPTVTFELGKDEALVLFELLQGLSNQTALPVENVAARLALLRLFGALEGTLVEIFMHNYEALIQDARTRLTQQYGEV
jgi:hypothetical protein